MKKLKILLYSVAVFLLTVFITGCVLFEKKENEFPEPTNIEDYDGPEKLSPIIANKILDRTVKGLKDGSYNDFSYRFNVDLKKRITTKEFNKLREELSDTIGEFKNREFLGALRKGPLTIYLWKAQFSKAENNDLVIKLTLGELDNAVQVFAFDISQR